MKKSVFLVVSLLCVVLMSRPVYAIADFNLGGTDQKFLYSSYWQKGAHGFFGQYDVDNSSTSNFSSMNGWVGNLAANDYGQIVSGTNVVGSKISVEANPQIAIDWVSANAKFIIDAYEIGSVPGSYNPVSAINLASWAITARTPLAEIAYGKANFMQGFGLQFSGNRTADYIMVSQEFPVPDILAGLLSTGFIPRKTLNSNQYTCSNSWNSGSLRLGFGVIPSQTIMVNALSPQANDQPLNNWNPHDVNATVSQNLMFCGKYSTPELTLASGITYTNYHQGPELRALAVDKINTPTKDTYLTEGWLALQYSNSTFAISTELDWYNRIIHFQKSQSGQFIDPDLPAGTVPIPGDFGDGSGRSHFAPQFIQSWRYMLELKKYQGPYGANLFYSYMPGRDRRHGILIDNQPQVTFNNQAALGPFSPYSVLLSSVFSGGVNAPHHISDASIYAVKFDYAMAANVALSLSYLNAVRNSDGFGWGYIRPDATTPGNVLYQDAGNFLAPSPAIPDKDLGWELVAAVNWKLLEQLSLEVRMAYWQPGAWFKYACVDRSVQNWDIPSGANFWGVNPNRSIDPIMGLELRLQATP
jgi:hypothetical protein